MYRRTLLSLLTIATVRWAVAQDAVPRRTVLLVGPPGAGKTTQAKRLAQQLSISYISMADILRKEGGGKSGLNKRMKAQIAGGDLVSDEMANALVEKYIVRKEAKQGFVLDGYPWTNPQAEYLDRTIASLGLPSPVVIHLDVSDDVARERLRSRRRADDTPENIERRLKEYRQHESFVVQRYGSAVKRIGGGQSPEQVWQGIAAALKIPAGT